MKKIKVLTLFTSILSVGVSSSLTPLVNPVFAEDLVPQIETTLPTDDLLGDKEFREGYFSGVYDFGSSSNCEVLSFMEYNYRKSYTTDYGLYVYVFNPSINKQIDITSGRNKIQMSVSSSDIPQWNKYNLIFVSKSIGDENNKFYKFKVEIDENFYNSLTNKNERKYNISGVEILMLGDSNATEIEVSASFN